MFPRWQLNSNNIFYWQYFPLSGYIASPLDGAVDNAKPKQHYIFVSLIMVDITSRQNISLLRVIHFSKFKETSQTCVENDVKVFLLAYMLICYICFYLLHTPFLAKISSSYYNEKVLAQPGHLAIEYCVQSLTFTNRNLSSSSPKFLPKDVHCCTYASPKIATSTGLALLINK